MFRKLMASCQKFVVKSVGILGAAALGLSAAPAVANSASASDSFRITEEDVKENTTALGQSDPEFRAMHGDWGKATGQGTSSDVAVPSINPVEAMRLSSGFGYRRAPTRGASRNHKGIDIPGPVGTPIYATADGIVGFSGRRGGYGKYIEIEHGNEIQTRYAHLSALNVRFGQRVRKGEIIGYMGSTGRSTGSHLHYEVRIAGVAVNPMAFIDLGNTDESMTKLLLAGTDVDITAAGGPEE